MIIHAKEGYNPLGRIEDANGAICLMVKAHDNLTINTGYLVRMGTVGWISNDLVSASYGWAYVGFPQATMTSGTVGRLQIGGLIEDAVIGASVTGTAGSAVEWILATLTSAAQVPGSSTSFSHFGVFATAQSAATTVHDLVLFGERVQCNA